MRVAKRALLLVSMVFAMANAPAWATKKDSAVADGNGRRLTENGLGDSADGERDAARSGGHFWERAHPLTVQRGVLTVDGMTVRTGLNLRTNNLRYLYVFVPGAGTTVIAEQPFAGAREQKGAFKGKVLTVSAGGSKLQLTATNKMRSGHSAYVRFDRGAGTGARTPMVGLGTAAVAPAVWSEEAEPVRRAMRRMSVNDGRRLRTAKLCRPSRKGKELCATVREVVYRP